MTDYIKREDVLRRIRAVLAKDEDTFIRNYLIDNIAALPDASPVNDEREEVARRLETEFDQDDVAHAARLLRAPQQQAESWPLDFNGYLIERAVGWRLPECVAPPPDDEAVALLQPAFDALDKINTRPVSDWEVRRAAEIACFYAVQQFRAYLAR